MTDRDTGKPRGFGFVEMANATDADKAIAALNGTLLDERALNVNEAPQEGTGKLPRPRLPEAWRKALVVPAGSNFDVPYAASPYKS
jgi:RNA recognition motif-containing protein